MTTAIQLTPQDTIERGLALAAAEGADGCVVIVAETSSANLRWANNTLTTNGAMRGSSVTVIATGRSVPSFGLILRLRGVGCATGGQAIVIEITGRSTIIKPRRSSNRISGEVV